MAVTLADLVATLSERRVRGDLDRGISGLAQDSRQVRPGDLFACIRGEEFDGHDFAPEALALGAAAFLVEEWLPLPPEIPQVRVLDARRAAALLAARLHGNPSRSLRVIGVTGTNGKTTVTYLLEAILTAAGHPTGRIGSIDYQLIGERRPSVLTTPEAPELQEMLHTIKDHGGRYAVVEASSHALHMGRLEGCEFDVAVFTNLSHDHLDYHRDRDAYLRAKARLFTGLGCPGAEKENKRAVINGDDPAGREIAAVTPVPVTFFGLDPPAAVTAEDVEFAGLRTRFRLIDRQGGRATAVDLPLPGLCNVSNALAAAAAALAEGVPLQTIARALETFPGVPGRYELIDAGGGVSVMIDYAHNPDGLRHILGIARRLVPGAVVSVFGQRGRRDRSKRPVMGRIAAELADRCVITTDDPYDEDPGAIIRDLLEGVVEGGMAPEDYAVIPDRAQAIRAALDMAGPGGIVVVTGKGHERYRVFGEERVPYSERDTVMGVVAERRGERVATVREPPPPRDAGPLPWRSRTPRPAPR